MTGQTHRVGGMLCCLVGYSILQDKGMLVEDVSPALQLACMYPFAIYGSIVSDLDHGWHSAPSKDIFSFFINKVLHLTTGLRQKGIKNPLFSVFDAQHRSWQTHSDLFLGIFIYWLIKEMRYGMLSMDSVITRLILTGFILGVISHIILDMLTPEGIWSIPLVVIGKLFHAPLPKKIHLVPKSKFFSTGGKWEDFVRLVMWLVCFVLVARIIYIASPYTLVFAFK